MLINNISLILILLNVICIFAKGTIPKCRINAKTNILCKSNKSLSSLKDYLCKNGKDIYLVDDSGLLICKMPNKKEKIPEKRQIISRGDGSDGDEPENKCNLKTAEYCKTYNIDNEKLYQCITDMGCEEIIEVGYYINDKKDAYACENKNSGLSCKKLKNTMAKESCTNKIGELVLSDNSIISICLTKDNAVELDNSHSGNYVVEKGKNDIFGIAESGGYAIINVKENVAILNKDYKNQLKYIYVNDSYKVMNKEDKTCPMKTKDAIDEEKILELECDNGICKSNETKKQ